MSKVMRKIVKSSHAQVAGDTGRWSTVHTAFLECGHDVWFAGRKPNIGKTTRCRRCEEVQNAL